MTIEPSIGWDGFLCMQKKQIIPILALLFSLFSFSAPSQTDNFYVKKSKELLTAVKKGKSTDKMVKEFENISLDSLVDGLNSQNEKLAFWINTYNAFIQIILSEKPELYEDRGEFFGNKLMTIAGIEMSFDDIEHSIMRNSRNKLSGGYLKKWCEPKWIKRLRNEDIDGRIHFAINCGAKSCPPVAIYDDTTLDRELNRISKAYLKDKTTIDGETVTTTPLFSWFRADFGGKRGIKKFLKNKGIVNEGLDIDLEFGNYDWTLSLGDYVE